MASLHQLSLLEQLQLDGPKLIHKLEEMESKFQKKLLKQRKRKYQEEYEPEQGPSSEPMMPAIPIIHNQESGEKENDVHDTSVKDLHSNDVHIGNLASCSEVQTTGVESLEVCTQIVEEPVDATVISLTTSTSGDVIPSLVGSASTSSDQDRAEEGFLYVENFKIPKEYEILYTKIYGKYVGHIATKKVIKSSDTMLEVCVSDLLRIISEMETTRGAELNEELLNEWEGFIRDAETLKFNVKWFREEFDRVKSHWMSESDEQVLDALQVDYVGLCTKQDELEADLSEVKIQIKKAVAMISSKREAIREKQAQKIFFQNEPVLRIAFD